MIVCIVALLLTLSGCARANEEANERLETQTRGMLDALLADDCTAAYAFVSSVTSEEDFVPVYAQMREMLVGVTSYSLERLKHNSTDTSYALSFYMTANTPDGEATYAITAQEAKGGTGFNAFHLQKNAVVVGTLFTMRDATVWQWCVLIFGVLAWGLTAFAAIDCLRNAKDSKGMGLMLILMGLVTFSFTLAPEFSLSVTHGYYFPYTAYVTASTGETVLHAFLPLGAIGYFLLRRRFLHPEEQ